MWSKFWSKIKSIFSKPQDDLVFAQEIDYRFTDDGDLSKSCSMVYGCPKDPDDIRDYKKEVPKATLMQMSDKNEFTLRKFLPNVRNQRNTGSCTGFSATYAAYIIASRLIADDMLFNQHSTSKVLPPFSPLWVYYNARKYSGLQFQDGGAYIRDAMKSLKEYGVIQEGHFSFSEYGPLDKPPAFDSKVKTYKLHNYMRILLNYNTVPTLKAVLLEEKLPVVAGISIYENSYDSYGVFKLLPPEQRVPAKCHGSHAVCITGFKTIDGELYFEFVNSWGSLWGDEGFGYLPAEMMNDPNYVNDLWTFDKEYF